MATPNCFARRTATPPSQFGGNYTAVCGYVKFFARVTFSIP
ncbi:hypothetical protein BH18ACT12_BH18ACT12_00080 [soil metagenome]